MIKEKVNRVINRWVSDWRYTVLWSDVGLGFAHSKGRFHAPYSYFFIFQYINSSWKVS